MKKRLALSIGLSLIILPVLFLIKFLVESFTLLSYQIHFEVLLVAIPLLALVLYKAFKGRV